jgi:hypothetical protein
LKEIREALEAKQKLLSEERDKKDETSRDGSAG